MFIIPQKRTMNTYKIDNFIFLFPGLISLASLYYLLTNGDLGVEYFWYVLLANIILFGTAYLKKRNLLLILHKEFLEVSHPLQNKNYYIPYKDIKDIYYLNGVIGKLANYGTIRILLVNNITINLYYLQNGKKLLTKILDIKKIKTINETKHTNS